MIDRFNSFTVSFPELWAVWHNGNDDDNYVLHDIYSIEVDTSEDGPRVRIETNVENAEWLRDNYSGYLDLYRSDGYQTYVCHVIDYTFRNESSRVNLNEHVIVIDLDAYHVLPWRVQEQESELRSSSEEGFEF